MKARLNHVCVNEGSSKYSRFITMYICSHCVFGIKMGVVLYLNLHSPAYTFKDFCLGYVDLWLRFGKVWWLQNQRCAGPC